MRKRILTIVMVFVLALSLTACGGSSNKEEKTEETKTDTTEEETAEKTGGWYEYEDILTVCFEGMSEAGELAVFVASDDMTFAVLGVADPETAESVSFVGELTEDADTGYLTITDETSETSLTFEVIDNGDETLTLDMGDTGKVTIVSCTQDEAFDLLDTLDQYTEPVS